MDSRRRPDDDAPWSDLEQGFFASAPPDVPEPPEAPPSFDDLVPATEPPKPAIPAWLRRAFAAAAAARGPLSRLSLDVRRRAVSSIASTRRHAADIAAAAWRGSALALRATRGPIRRHVRAVAIWFVGPLSTGRRYRPVITYALASAILVMGLSAGIVAPPNEAVPSPSPNEAVTNPPTAPVGAPADIGDGAEMRQATPVGPPPPSAAAPEPPVRSSAQSRPRRSETAKQPPRPHRPRRPAPSSARDLMQPTFARDLMQPTFMSRGGQPTVEHRPPPVPASRPFFSR